MFGAKLAAINRTLQYAAVYGVCVQGEYFIA
jgi:hypothetical protein